MRYSEFKRYITEGGNIFKDENGEIQTRSITKSDIEPTIRWLEKISNLPLVDNTLGSVGKKEHSGDLDIAVDENVISKDELVSHLIKWAKDQKLPDDQIINKRPFKGGWLDKSGISVHFKTPIRGDASNGYAQTDFMFTDDIAWMKFSMFSAGDDSRYSGADRNLLMSSIAKSLPGDFKYSWQKGLIARSTGETISKDPDQIAAVLLGKGYKQGDLESVETIMGALSKDKTRLTQLKNSAAKLRDIEGKKTGEAKADAEEANRIELALKAAS